MKTIKKLEAFYKDLENMLAVIEVENYDFEDHLFRIGDRLLDKHEEAEDLFLELAKENFVQELQLLQGEDMFLFDAENAYTYQALAARAKLVAKVIDELQK